MLSHFLSPLFYYICPAVLLQLLKMEKFKRPVLSVSDTSQIDKFLITVSTSSETNTGFEQESLKKIKRSL
jgi:hypothetical protein